uniref:MULE transposase domain-containing protein n=1 Tax=Tanacetum cinerariifolium TaxID=118510 RepID=A0A699HF21_TANCI|nr:hypothetical protein [Tanacetum cinerariifolium]
MPYCILTLPTDESVITYTQLSDGEACFADIVGSGVDSLRLSHDESFEVDDLDLNLNEPINLNVSKVETQSELRVSEEPDVGPTQEPILAEVSTQEPNVAEVSTQKPIVVEISTEAPIVEEVGTQEFSVEDVIIEDYVKSVEDAEQGNGQEDESAPTNGQFFYDDEGIDTVYETEYEVQSSEDAGIYDDDDDVDEDFLVDEENEIVEPDVDVYLFGINMDLPFDNIDITNLVPGDVLEGEDVDVINADGFDSDPCNDEEKNYRKRRRNLKLYKNESVRIRARYEGKVLLFTMSQGTGPTGPYSGMEAGPSRSSGLTTKSNKRKNTGQVLVAVGLDSNNRIFPLAYALVEAKTKIHGAGSCSVWVMTYLHPNSNFTFISDRQKGIILAVKTVYPSSKHRYFLRHIHENIKQRWCGQAYKDLLRRAASAINVKDFEKCMLELKTMNPKAHEWLNKIPAEHWARSHFSVGGRDKPVITLLEYIREYCMKRIVNVQGVIDKCTDPLTHAETGIMESIKKEAHLMKELMGIPCKHVVASCWNMAMNDRATPLLETWVNSCYWLSTWKETYSHKIQTIYGTNYWEKSTCPTTLLPPKHHVQVETMQKAVVVHLGKHNKQNLQLVKMVQVVQVLPVKFHPILDGQGEEEQVEKLADVWRTTISYFVEKGLGSGDLRDHVSVVGGTDDGDKETDVIKDTVSQKNICEEDVPLNNNTGKQIGDFVDMPSEAVEKRMDANVPDEIDGAKGE